MTRFLCWLLGHRLDRGTALGWSGIVKYRCTRASCDHSEQTTFDF